MEIWFYHLQRQSLDEALPGLIEKALERGWRVVVQASSEERIAALDERLWTYADASFLAHGRAADGDAAMQPVYLTTGDENPNAAAVRILVEGAPVAASLGAGPYERAILAFDGAQEDELAAARLQWKALKDQGFAVTYWRQSETGRWEKQG
jgi:DNA polymerase-3 subunit chi